MNIIDSLEHYKKRIEDEIEAIPSSDKIPLFYDPIYYINRLSGKKIRPLLTVLSGLAVGGKFILADQVAGFHPRLRIAIP